jgi:hypothetical protein
MPDLTPEQQKQIVDALIALGWIRPPSALDPRSAQIINEYIGCSTEEAKIILQQLQVDGVIASVSESGGSPAASRTLDSYGWRWVRV